MLSRLPALLMPLLSLLSLPLLLSLSLLRLLSLLSVFAVDIAVVVAYCCCSEELE